MAKGDQAEILFTPRTSQGMARKSCPSARRPLRETDLAARAAAADPDGAARASARAGGKTPPSPLYDSAASCSTPFRVLGKLHNPLVLLGFFRQPGSDCLGPKERMAIVQNWRLTFGFFVKKS
jgi:hypothetical protein